MRGLADANLARLFMKELGRSCEKPARVYFTGGASAVLLGWRASTIDLDIKIVSWTRRRSCSRRLIKLIFADYAP